MKSWLITHQIVNVAMPGDNRIEGKELENITKYHDLKIKVKRLCHNLDIVVPVIIGNLGAIYKNL